MSSNSTSPTTPCDDQTCSNAKRALCLHCSQHDRLTRVEDQIKSLQFDEHLRRTIYSLDQWRKNLLRTIEDVYQEKLSSVKANSIQLNNYLQEFQFEQLSHIQVLRIELEQMKLIRSTYVEERENIQQTIKHLQNNLSDLQYGLDLKEHSITNISKSIECQIIWKRCRTDEINDHDTGVKDDIHDYSTNSTSILSSTSYEHCLLSYLVGNDSTNKDDQVNSTDSRQSNKKKSPNQTSTVTLNSNKKKRRFCINCGKCYHPISLQRHSRQCKHPSSDKVTNTLH